jgi:heparosan-N-sulfate-glucuronate 5-epimerase
VLKPLTATLLLLAAAAPAPASADVGPYLDSATQPPLMASRGPATYPVMGPEGVPQVGYASGGVHDNPTTVAQYGLQQWSWWATSRQGGHLTAALTAADWLLRHQRPDGAWAYGFDFVSAGVPAPAPWISAMAQGQAISLLVRAHSATGDVRYLNAALLALGPFQRPVGQGGVVSDWEGVPWFELYAVPNAQHVLNGFEYALLGLSDLAPHSPVAATLFQQGVASLAARIARFDVPAQRGQLYAGAGAGRYLADPNYERAHVLLTQEIARRSGQPTIALYAARWAGYQG